MLQKFYKDHSFFGDKKDKAIRGLMTEALKTVENEFAEKTLSLMHQEDGMLNILRDSYNESEALVFLKPDSPIFTGELFNKLTNIFLEAPKNHVVHTNCVHYLFLILRRINTGTRTLVHDQVKELLQKEVFIKALWSSVISQKFQYRMVKELGDDREKLISEGVNESWLPLPDPNWISSEYWTGEDNQEPPKKAANQ